MCRPFAITACNSILCNIGYPFAMVTLDGLTPLTVWLIKPCVMPERIDLGCPQQKRRHERMHCTLKIAKASPPRGNVSAQHHTFDRFRLVYNEECPHQNPGYEICPVLVRQLSPSHFQTHWKAPSISTIYWYAR
jgi:hypothetical protein